MSEHNILVIDDDIVDLKALEKTTQSVLNQHELGNIETLSFSCAVKAINFLENSSNTVLIICDIHMPGTDAVDFIRNMTIRNDPTPLVLVSGVNLNTMQITEKLGHSSGVNILTGIEKPVTPLDLNKVFKVLELVR